MISSFLSVEMVQYNSLSFLSSEISDCLNDDDVDRTRIGLGHSPTYNIYFYFFIHFSFSIIAVKSFVQRYK